MGTKPELSIGRKSRAKVCPVCMRSKEDAIAEQLKTGTSCGHVKCKFKTEINLMFKILNAPNIEQLQSITGESIDANKKIYELMLGMRESVKGMKDRIESSKIQEYYNLSGNSNENNITSEEQERQIKEVVVSIDRSTETMSRLIEKLSIHENLPSNPEPVQATSNILSEEEYKKKIAKLLANREEYRKKLDEAFTEMNLAVKGMNDAVQEMNDDNEKEKQANHKGIFKYIIKFGKRTYEKIKK